MDHQHLSFMPHAMCYLWQPDLIILHSLSDSIIGLTYIAIPLLLLMMVKTRFSAYASLVSWFIAFIMLCGLTHIMEVITIWQPSYYLSGFLKLATALVSIGALHHLIVLTRATQKVIERDLQEQDFQTASHVIREVMREAKVG